METPIQPFFYVQCNCGANCKFVFIENRFVDRQCPECKEYVSVDSGGYGLTWRKVFEAFGIKFSLDWDRSLVVTHQEPLSEDLQTFLWRHQADIIGEILAIARNEQSVLTGGPFNGEKFSPPFSRSMKIIKNCGKAKWAVYAFKGDKDHRMYFAGYATSEQKARRLVAEWDQKPKE